MKKLNSPIHIFFLCICLSVIHTRSFGGVDGLSDAFKYVIVGGAAGVMTIGAISYSIFMKGLQHAAYAPSTNKRYAGWVLMGTAVALPVGTLISIARLLT